MSLKKRPESQHERELREYQESIQAEPDWNNTEISKAWLEERYPLLDDAMLGSPLFRYIKECVKDPKVWRGRAPTFLASMLAFYEMMRFSGETRLGVAADPTREILYPDYGWPRLRGPEPEWTDIEASRLRLEQRHPLGRSERGSPLFQHMRTCYAAGDSRGSPMKHLGSMLTENEWMRFLRHCPIPDRQRHHGDHDNVLYPEYDERMWSDEYSVLKVENGRPLSSPDWPRTTSLAQPAAKPAESYLPHQSTQTPSSSHSNKRKGEDRDGGPSEHPASKRRCRPSDSGEGVVMPAKPIDSDKKMDGPRKQHDIGFDAFGHQAEASPTEMPLTDLSKKRGIEDVSDELSASSASKRRRTSPDLVGDSSPVSGPPMEWNGGIADVNNAPPATSSPKRLRTPPYYAGNDLSPSSPFDPPERSTPTPFPRSDVTPTKTSYEDPTTVIFGPNEMEEEPAPQSAPQSEETDGRRNPEVTNPDDPLMADLRDHEAAMNSGSDTRQPGKGEPVPPEPNVQHDDHTPIKEDPEIIESERPRDQRTSSFTQNRGDRAGQTAISVVIPLQRPQHQPAECEDLSADELTLDVPVIRRTRGRGRKPGTNGRKAPKPEPHFDQRKGKTPAHGRKNRQPNQEYEPQPYVGRLRSGVGQRKHDKPSKYFMPP